MCFKKLGIDLAISYVNFEIKMIFSEAEGLKRRKMAKLFVRYWFLKSFESNALGLIARLEFYPPYFTSPGDATGLKSKQFRFE